MIEKEEDRHPSEAELAEYSAGRRIPEVDRHLGEDCLRCHRTVDLYRRIATALAETQRGNVEVPAATHSAAIRIYRPRDMIPVEKARSLPRILADLIFDSIRQPVPVGARTSLLSERQLLFRVEGFDVDLRIRPGDRRDGSTLTGQILPRGDGFLGSDRLQVWLESPGQGLFALEVTEFGEFGASRLSSGSQQLEFIVDQRACYRLCFIL